jgi:ribosomal protein L17
MKHLSRKWKLGAGSVRHHEDLRKNLLGQLICHDQIITTEAKAKMLQEEMESVRNQSRGGNSPH